MYAMTLEHSVRPPRYRAISLQATRKAGPAARSGLYGFGASAHIVAQVAAIRDQEVFPLTRPRAIRRPGVCPLVGCGVVGGSDRSRRACWTQPSLLPRWAYWSRLLCVPWLKAGASDAVEFFASPYRRRVMTRTRCYPMTEANTALDDLRARRFEGAAFLTAV